MSLPDKQRQLVERLLIIEDSHERLSAITARGRKWPAPPAEARIDAHRVQGCASPVWLVARIESGLCRFQIAAESSLVQGLAALLCELYDGAAPAEVAAFEPTLIADLALDRQLSPTRLNGLANVRRVIREFAVAQLSGEGGAHD